MFSEDSGPSSCLNSHQPCDCGQVTLPTYATAFLSGKWAGTRLLGPGPAELWTQRAIVASASLKHTLTGEMTQGRLPQRRFWTTAVPDSPWETGSPCCPGHRPGHRKPADPFLSNTPAPPARLPSSPGRELLSCQQPGPASESNSQSR